MIHWAEIRSRPTPTLFGIAAVLAAALVTATVFGVSTDWPTAQAQQTNDYDQNNNGLIDITNLAQLDAVRYDLDGDGSSNDSAYDGVFNDPVPGMGCPDTDNDNNPGPCLGYELRANLDFDTNGNGRADAGDAYWNSGAGWSPIGDTRLGDANFSATFDGGDHTIDNLFIDAAITSAASSTVGLFGTLNGAKVKNVGLTGVDVTVTVNVANASQDYNVLVGALAGLNSAFVSSAATTITGSWSSGDVTVRVSNADEFASTIAGGLVGYNWSNGAITASYSSADVTSEALSGAMTLRGGGLTGVNNGTIAASHASGDVTANNAGLVPSVSTFTPQTQIGGLVASNIHYTPAGRLGTITDSYATGDVTATGGVTWHTVGGLAGSSGGPLTGSYATGDVTATGGVNVAVGGLAGVNGSGWPIIGSYATGDATATGNTGIVGVGGLVGDGFYGDVAASYASGDVTATGGAYVATGGLVGRNRGGAHSDGRCCGAVTASYASGDVTATSGGELQIGGLVGRNYPSGVITASYSTGSLSGTGATITEKGGLVGANVDDNAIVASYWDTDASGTPDDADGVAPEGKTALEIVTPTSYGGIYAAWNVDVDNADGDDDLTTGGDAPWDFGTSYQYPVLKYGGLDVAEQRRSVTPPSLTPPEPVVVENVKVKTKETLAVVTWDALEGATGYTVEWTSNVARGRASWARFSSQDAARTSATIRRLAPGYDYAFRVRATNLDDSTSAQVMASTLGDEDDGASPFPTYTPTPTPTPVATPIPPTTQVGTSTTVTLTSSDGTVTIDIPAGSRSAPYQVNFESQAGCDYAGAKADVTFTCVSFKIFDADDMLETDVEFDAAPTVTFTLSAEQVEALGGEFLLAKLHEMGGLMIVTRTGAGAEWTSVESTLTMDDETGGATLSAMPSSLTTFTAVAVQATYDAVQAEYGHLLPRDTLTPPTGGPSVPAAALLALLLGAAALLAAGWVVTARRSGA